MQKKKSSSKLVILSILVIAAGALFAVTQFGGMDDKTISGAAIAALADRDAASKLPADQVVELDSEADITEEIGIGAGIANASQPKNYFDSPLRDDDLAVLQDTEVSFNNGGGYNKYDVSGELWFGTDSPSIETALSKASVDDDYKDGVAIEVTTDAIYYYYSFDEAINLSMASEDYPVQIKFWGKDMKITGVGWDGSGTADRISVKVGEVYYISIGDEITVKGHKIKLEDVGDAKIAVSVDGGEIVTIDEDSSHSYPEGLEVVADSVFYKSGDPTASTANLIVGQQATTTYTDGDAYVGEDEDNEYWRWEIDNLQLNAQSDISAAGTATGPVLAMKNYFVVDDASGSDPAPAINNGCYDMTTSDPFMQLCIDGLSTDSYTTVTVDLANVDLRDAGGAYYLLTSQAVLRIKSSASDSLRVDQSQLGVAIIASDMETDEIYLMLNNTVGVAPLVDVFYVNPSSNDVVFAGSLTALSTQPFAYVDYKDTRGTDVLFGFQGVDAANRFSLNITEANGEIPGTTSRIGVYVGNNSAAAFNNLVNVLHVNDLHDTDISTQDEDLRTEYGIVIKDPQSGLSGDDLEFKVPSDAIRAKITLKALKQATDSSGGSTLASSITSLPDGAILVGGPAANEWTANVMSTPYPTYGPALGWQDGWCYIDELTYKGNSVIVIAGWDVDDTDDCVDEYLKGTKKHNNVLA